MKFDANRMAQLAGLGDQGSSQIISEAGNRSMHDEQHHDVEHRLGKGQLAEEDYAEEDPYMGEEDVPDDEEDDLEEYGPALAAVGRGAMAAARSPAAREFVKGASYTAGGAAAGKALSEKSDVIYDINEDMLRKELKRMRQQRAHHVNESKVRNVVREEIIDLLKEISEEDLNNGTSWLYGDNKPTKSKKGQVAVGAFGIGFE